MNKNIAILLSLIVLLFSVYFLYTKGELNLDRASEKFTVLAFENSSLNCDKESLKFFIENNLPYEKEYQISILADQKELTSHSDFKIPNKSSKYIELEGDLINELCNKKQTFRFEVQIENNQTQENIYKFINQ